VVKVIFEDGVDVQSDFLYNTKKVYGIYNRIFQWEHIKCKPISPCKPCKLQSEPPDQHSRGMEGFDNFTINHPPLNWVIILLQILPPTPPAPSDWRTYVKLLSGTNICQVENNIYDHKLIKREMVLSMRTLVMNSC